MNRRTPVALTACLALLGACSPTPTSPSGSAADELVFLRSAVLAPPGSGGRLVGDGTNELVEHPWSPGDSLVLNKTLGPWKSTLSPFGAQAAFERVGDSTLEGRPVRVYRLGLAPPLSPDLDRVLSPDEAANLSGQAVTPISLTGLVYIDVETGNRLLAEVEGRYVPRRIIGNVDPTDEVLVTFRESRSPTQLRATIEPPDPTRVRRGTRPGLHAPTPRPRGR